MMLRVVFLLMCSLGSRALLMIDCRPSHSVLERANDFR
jgi:hypothetical protein